MNNKTRQPIKATPDLRGTAASDFFVHWFNRRDGGELIRGEIGTVTSGKVVDLNMFRPGITLLNICWFDLRAKLAKMICIEPAEV